MYNIVDLVSGEVVYSNINTLQIFAVFGDFCETDYLNNYKELTFDEYMERNDIGLTIKKLG